MIRFVDLTYPIHEGMLTYDRPWHTKVCVEQMAEICKQGRETRKFVLGSHTGTHIDAPAHFVEEGGGVETIPLDALMGPAVLLDYSSLPPLTEISRARLEEDLEGKVPERLVLRFDWDRFWGSEEYYEGHPYLSENAARWLADEGLQLLGMDTPMPDNPEPKPGSADSPIHKILLSERIVLLEYLCNLDQLASRAITLIALPLKVVGSDGAPTRCVAVDAPIEF